MDAPVTLKSEGICDECETVSWLRKEQTPADFSFARGTFNIDDESPWQRTLYPSERKNSTSPSDTIINYVLPLTYTASSFSLGRIMARTYTLKTSLCPSNPSSGILFRPALTEARSLAPRRALLGSALENSTRCNYEKIRSKSVNLPADATVQLSRSQILRTHRGNPRARCAREIAQMRSKYTALVYCVKLYSVDFPQFVRTLFVSGLPMDTKPRELYLLFRAYEAIASGRSEEKPRLFVAGKERGQVEKQRNGFCSIWNVSLFDDEKGGGARRGAARHGFFLLLASSLVLYIHEIVVSSSLKGIRISRVGVLGITFPSVPRAPAPEEESADQLLNDVSYHRETFGEVQELFAHRIVRARHMRVMAKTRLCSPERPAF
ncbi:hypothetical protein DBV15_10684 [Temnothorax longispinosus]|uniref:Uncharacterized protein n=1 Tax=Temnothorax longispinosus TaxID=300112 RepID=A0A4S2KWC7_9HYME|nr:hypothetical protein DBV15_10684 [Temnothorax longispinosus]